MNNAIQNYDKIIIKYQQHLPTNLSKAPGTLASDPVWFVGNIKTMFDPRHHGMTPSLQHLSITVTLCLESEHHVVDVEHELGQVTRV